MLGKFLFHDLTATIADYMYYTDHETEIDQWLELHDSERMGMIIKFDSENTKLMFMMRWV